MIAERPREIGNALTGEQVRFVRTATETAGELLVLEARWTRPDHVTPPHIHPAMEERWTILEGRVGFRIDGAECVAAAGESVVAPPGSLHTSWNAGAEPVLMRIELRPALRWEEFVRQLFALASENLQGEAAKRSVTELLTEFEAEIVIPPA